MCPSACLSLTRLCPFYSGSLKLWKLMYMNATFFEEKVSGFIYLPSGLQEVTIYHHLYSRCQVHLLLCCLITALWLHNYSFPLGSAIATTQGKAPLSVMGRSLINSKTFCSQKTSPSFNHMAAALGERRNTAARLGRSRHSDEAQKLGFKPVVPLVLKAPRKEV